MRHGKRINHLGRTSSHRKAMISNMASSLILHKRIRTTLAKAKSLRTFVEPLITRSKNDSTHNRRVVFSYLQNKEAVSELFREISKKIAERPGGYTRILKTGNRAGDNAEMCLIELVDYNEAMLGTKEEAKGKTTRRRRSTTKKKETEAKGKAEEAVVEDTGAEEKPKKPRRSSKKTTTAEAKEQAEAGEQTESAEEKEESKE
jgi:large subunit ribosomal protein L17